MGQTQKFCGKLSFCLICFWNQALWSISEINYTTEILLIFLRFSFKLEMVNAIIFHRYYKLTIFELLWMWELDCEEDWALKNWCFWTVVLEKTLESPLDCKEIQPIHSEGDQPWDFCGRNDAKAETPVLWPPHVKSWLIGKDSNAGRDWGQEEKGMTEDEMPGWHHWLDGRESEWTPGVGDGQGGLACCNSWGRRKLDTTERLNWTELNIPY